MGYTVHIRRKSAPIALEEWKQVASTTAELSPDGAPSDSGEFAPLYRWNEAVFRWERGEVIVANFEDDWSTKLAQIAERLKAEAVGDDGERYLADGRVDYGDGAQTLQRIQTIAALGPDPELVSGPLPARLLRRIGQWFRR